VAGVAGLGLGGAGYATFVEPEEISVERLDIHLSRLPEGFDGLKIAQISDLHYGPFTGAREIGAAADHVNALGADLVVVTGDFITSPLLERTSTPASTTLANAGRCARVLSRIRAPLGVFAALGNHDVTTNPGYISEVLQAVGIRVLRNGRAPLERSGARLWLAGVDDVLDGQPRLDQALAGVPRREPLVLMAHEPDFADEASLQNVDLQLSGHSHGGQVRLPLIGAPYLPRLARKYPYGHYLIRQMQLYTNRGIGTIGVPMRFGAPPEVTLFTLRAGRPAGAAH